MTVQFFVNHVLALARRRVEWVEHLEEFAETLCTTAAGGRGQAEALSVFAQTLCATAAGGRGQAEALSVFAQTLCATAAGGRGQAQEPDERGEHLYAFAQTL